MGEVANGVAWGLSGVAIVAVLFVLTVIAIVLKHLRPLGWVMLAATVIVGYFLFA